jgi:hypothetical protein
VVEVFFGLGKVRGETLLRNLKKLGKGKTWKGLGSRVWVLVKSHIQPSN